MWRLDYFCCVDFFGGIGYYWEVRRACYASSAVVEWFVGMAGVGER